MRERSRAEESMNWHIRAISNMMQTHPDHLDNVDYAALENKISTITSNFLGQYNETELDIGSAIMLITVASRILEAIAEQKSSIQLNDVNLFQLYLAALIISQKIHNDEMVFTIDIADAYIASSPIAEDKKDVLKILNAIELTYLKLIDYRTFPKKTKNNPFII